jgi:hypothetical protein
MPLIFEIIHETLVISGFVLLLMILIEYLHAKTLGNWNEGFLKNKLIQIIFSTVFASIPGCAGIFTIVSLYAHNLIYFPALLSATVASFGDEAFIIFAYNTSIGIKLMLLLVTIGFLTGIIFFRFKEKTYKEHHFVLHGEDCCKHEKKNLTHNIRKITFQRFLLISTILLIAFNMFLFSYVLEGEHSHFKLSPESIIFIVLLGLSAFVVLTVPEHFLTEHIWEHVIKKHFFNIFVWALVTISVVYNLNEHIDLQKYITNNVWLLLFLAILIGILPLSGPHVIFFTLFTQQLVPFSILLANSIVQEGHGGILLLADNKKTFLIIKLIKIFIALIISLPMIYLGL